MTATGVIYVVTNGMGADLDSWWTDLALARRRAAELNRGARMTLGWTVVPVGEGVPKEAA